MLRKHGHMGSKNNLLYGGMVLEDLELSTGARIPWIGFGTGVVRRYSRNPWLFLKVRLRPILASIKRRRLDGGLKSDLFAERFCRQAIEKGYRLFDCGRIYGYSEVVVGEAVAASGLPREDFFLATKVSDMDVERFCSPNDVRGNLMDSLRYLKTSYADAYLLHWPHGDWIGIYHQMEELYEEGLVRSIGVCNFTLQHFKELEKQARVQPMLCQTELHPFNSKKEIRDYCAEHGITLMAHTPTGRMCERIRQNPVLQELAKKHGKTIAQIILRWHRQNHVIPVVATCSTDHMEENMDVSGFALSEDEMQRIEEQDEGYVMLPGNGIDDPNYIYNL